MPIFLTLISSVVYYGLLFAIDTIANKVFPFCFHPVKCFNFEDELQRSIDENYGPCDDLYLHVCNRWRRNHPHYRDQSSLLNTRTQYTLMEALAKPRQSKTSVLDRVALGYQQCLNVLIKKEEHGDVIKELFSKYHYEWPTDTLSKDFDLLDMGVGMALDYDISLLFGLFVLPYYRTDSKYSLALDSSQGYIHVDYLVDAHEHNDERCIAQFAKVSSSEAQVMSSKVKEFLNDFSAVTVSLSHDKDPLVSYRKLGDFRNVTPTIPPAKWVDTLNKHLPSNASVGNDDEVLVAQSALPMLRYLLPLYKNKIADLMLVVGYIVIQRMSHAFSYQQLECMSGETSMLAPALTQVCVGMMNKVAPFAMARILYDEILDPVSVNITMDIFRDVREATQKLLEQSVWMSVLTRQEALQRLTDLLEVGGIAPDFLSTESIEDAYSFLPTFEKPFIEDYLEAKKLRMDKSKGLLSFPPGARPVRREDVEVDLVTVNSFYMTPAHIVFIPGSMMQAPYMNPKLPVPVRYGSMGHVLAHELSHAFDKTISKVSRTAEAKPLYDRTSAFALMLKLQCLSGQVTLVTDNRTLAINTLSVSYADNAGMEIASKAFRDLRDPGEGILGYTAQQMFFISACFKLCGLEPDKFQDGRHPPLQLRCDLPAINSFHFTEAFKCPFSSNMYSIVRCNFH
ncbi:neprilysin-1-like [Ornithodoros turicata]|uniref:neprilysin-1-like n=1 Tax=Ornithodoros turicata TaxID=34597 RepID=UPI0031398A5E